MKKEYAQIMDRLKVTDSMRNEVLKAVSETPSPEERKAQLKVHRTRGWHRGLVAAVCGAVACAVCLLVIPRTQVSVEKIAATSQPTISAAETAEQQRTEAASSDRKPAITVPGIVGDGTSGPQTTARPSDSRNEQTADMPGAQGNANWGTQTDNGNRPGNEIVGHNGEPQQTQGQVPAVIVTTRMPQPTTEMVPVPSDGLQLPIGSNVPGQSTQEVPANSGGPSAAPVEPQPTIGTDIGPAAAPGTPPPLTAATECPIENITSIYPPQCRPTTTATPSPTPDATEKPDTNSCPASPEQSWLEAKPSEETQDRPSCTAFGDSLPGE